MEILDKVSNIIKNKLVNLYMVKTIKKLKKAHTHTHTHTHTHAHTHTHTQKEAFNVYMYQ